MVSKLLICLLLISANLSIAQSSTNPDGKSYKVKLRKQTGKRIGSSWTEDSFIFESGKMYSLRMKSREGFQAASYAAAKQESIASFYYQNTNKYGSTLTIEGIFDDDAVEGTATWTNDVGTHTYTFTGTCVFTE